MLKTLSRLTSTFAELLADQNTDREVDVDESIEFIRTEMMYQLTTVCNAVDCTSICATIHGAADIQTLWYLRSNLVGVLAASMGERIARERIAPITEMFRGLVPKQFLIVSGAGPRSRSH